MSDLISEYRVMKSAAGWYIGQEYTNEDLCTDDGKYYFFPYDRLSGYFPDRESAIDVLRELVYSDVQGDDEYILCRTYYEDRVSFWHNLDNFS